MHLPKVATLLGSGKNPLEFFYPGHAMAFAPDLNLYSVNGSLVKLTDLVTTTRASTGYAETEAGVLVPFEANTLRHTDKGALVEEARTNLFLNSFAPVTQAITVVDATEYTLSIKGSGSAVLSGDGAGTATDGSPVTFTTTGTSVTVTISGGPDVTQLEAGGFATSFIETEGSSATRAADAVQFNDTSWFSATEGTMFAKIHGILVSSGRIFGTNAAGASTPLARESSVFKMAMWNGSVELEGPTVVDLRTRVSLHASSWDATGRSITSDGEVAVSDAELLGTFDNLFLGSRNGALEIGNSYVQRLVYWPERKSDAELQALTS